uniref:Uncharacterized protein n=1 Tax=Anopheles atroparvus TaxID=41427 RepID=A0AAG5DS36_ANOAO
VSLNYTISRLIFLSNHQFLPSFDLLSLSFHQLYRRLSKHVQGLCSDRHAD